MSSDPLDPNLGRLPELFEAQVGRTPNATAVVAGTSRLTYAEVDRRADRIAGGLRALGAGPERLVGVCLPRDDWLVPGIVGVLKSTAGYVPLDPAAPPLRLRQIAEDARMELVLATAATAGTVAGMGARPVLVDQLPAADPPAPAEGRPSDLAYVLFTSGSTGRPKGAALEHRQALTFLRWCAGAYSRAELAGSLAAASICFDLSILELLVPLFVGGTVIVAENLLALPTLPAAGEVTVLTGVPSAVAALLATPLPPGLRTLNIGGEVLTRALCDRVYANPGVRRVVNVYGPTECTPACLMHEVVRDERGEPPLGRVIGGAELTVRDPDGRPVPDGELGELWIAGPGVGRGYVNRAELTAERYLADPAAAGGRRYRSGDLVRRVGGVYYFGGRLDDQVKVRGLRVELGEVRAALMAHPAVRVAAVLAPVDATGNRRLAGYVEPDPDASHRCTEAALKEYLGERLPGYMVPSRIAVLDRIPLNSSGKVDRAALPPIETVDVTGQPYQAPVTDLERRLAAMVAEVLGLPRVGRTDRFTELGGHSLAAARVVAQVAAETGVAVSMEWFLGNPTVAALAARVGGPATGWAHVPRQRSQRQPASHPLTDMQRQFWTARRVSPNPAVTTVAIRFGLAGLAGAGPLAAALDAIVDRHEVLRSVVSDAGGRLAARVRPAAPVPLVEHDLRTAGAGEARRRADEIATGFARQALDPAHDTPLLRAALIWLGADRAELVVAIDHIAFDGVSIALFMQELAAGVAAAGRGDDPVGAVPPPVLQVADVAAVAPDLATLERDAAFWRRELAGVRPPYDLPGRRRTGPPDHRGVRLNRPLDPALLDAVADAAARVGGTRSAGLLTALAVLLDALTGRPDVLVGVAAAYRDLPGCQRTIGPLMGVLPVRVRWDDDPSFGTLLVRTLAATRRALAHRWLPAAELADGLAGSVARPPGASLTPVVLSVHPDGDPVAVEAGPVRVELLGDLDPGAAPNDLAIYVNHTVHGPQLQVEYALARFTAAEAESVADRYVRLLADAAADPDRPVSSFEVLTGGERDWLRRVGTGAALPPARPVVTDIVERAGRDPDRVAVVGAAGQLSYAELMVRSGRLAAALVERGAEPDSPVGVCLPRDHQLPATVLGVLRSGAGYLPLDPEQPAERTRQLVQDGGVRLVVATPATAPALAGLGAEVLDAGELVAGGGSAPLPDLRPQSLAYVLFTSGSTGRPKGVEVTHSNLASYVAAMQAEPGFRPEDTFLAVSPLWFDLSCFDLWVPLSIGARVAIADRETARDGFALAQWLDTAGVTAMDVPPTLLRMLLAAGWSGGPVRVISGGEALDSGLAQELADLPELWNAYGPTETTVTVTVQRVTVPAADPIPIGHPVPGARLYVCDRVGRLAPPGVAGELWIGGAGVARGYRGQPELTARGFVTDPVVDGARCYRSGDLARWLPDGSLEFAGRTDDQLKVRGYRIEPGEVEAALRDHPVVAHAAVAAGGSGLVGYVVPRPGAVVDVEALAAHLRRRLPSHLVPAQWSVLDRLPTTSSGKVDRRALPAPARPRPEVVAPRGPMEELIAEVWGEVLGLDAVGARDDFLTIGGHSLAAVRVAAALRERLGAEVPARVLFQWPVLADYAAEVERVALAQLADEVEVAG